ncbi:MAG: DUF5916 domain-containing protein [Bacteroidales bacterium]
MNRESITSGFVKKAILTCFLSVLGTVMISAQDAVKISRIGAAIEFNGRPDESAWQLLEKFPMVMHKPNFNSSPSEESDVRIGYDDNYLWIGARLYMKDPGKIYAVSKKRDEILFDYDAFGVLLDTYDDNENGLAFFTTPTGLRTDYAISNDATGFGPPGMNGSMNTSWNTFWDVKTTRDDKGWYVEMRIPFSSLKFKASGDVATMGLLITRIISSNNETDTYPSIDPKYGFMAPNKPSLSSTIQITGARPSKPVYISPYVISGFARDWALNEAGTAYVKDDVPKANIGLDVKYNINSNLTLDLTANTDFAQVEADDQQVNLTRYDLFFPEKRMFFQERASLFDFNLGGFSDNLFYSRNIGIKDGTPIRLLGGARLTGRIGRWDMGFLDMQTDKYDSNSGENFGVLRMRRQVLNENSYIGGIMTTRFSMDGAQNVAYGLDGIFRVFGDDYLNMKWAQAYDSQSGTKLNSLDPSFILLKWERRSEEGFAYRLDYTYAGQKFNPGVGFIQRGGLQGFNGEILYGWLPGEKSIFFNYMLNLRAERFTRLQDGGLESAQLSPEFEINTKKGLHAGISMEMQKEGVANDFNISDSISIKSGIYSFNVFQLRIGTSEARRLALRGDLNMGQFFDGNRFGVAAEPVFNVSSSLKLSGMYQYEAIRFPDRLTNKSLDIHSFNLKAIYMFSTKLSATVLLQYVNTEDELIGNFRLRYNPREGNDFYLVYNDFRGISRVLSIPERPDFYNKTIMVKYTHTFIL